MPLTKEQLLQKRFKFIIPYPGSHWEIGDIFESILGGDIYGAKNSPIRMMKSVLESYPEIFKELPWWSDRKPEDMPGYLRINYGNGPVLCKVSQWMHKIGEQMVFEYYKNGLALRETTKGTEPITEEEYNAYINQKQQ